VSAPRCSTLASSLGVAPQVLPDTLSQNARHLATDLASRAMFLQAVDSFSGALDIVLPLCRAFFTVQHMLPTQSQYIESVPLKAQILFVGLNPSAAKPSGTAFVRGTASGERFECLRRRLQGPACAINYCPVVFTRTGQNVNLEDAVNEGFVYANRLGKRDTWKACTEFLLHICDRHVTEVAKALDCKIVVGVGRFATRRVRTLGLNIGIAEIKHPAYVNDHETVHWVCDSLSRLPSWVRGHASSST
jgi:hypothetical protein